MDQRALERLGHHIVSSRVALGYRTRTDLANSLQFTVRTLADIEHGVRKASPGTALRPVPCATRLRRPRRRDQDRAPRNRYRD